MPIHNLPSSKNDFEQQILAGYTEDSCEYAVDHYTLSTWEILNTLNEELKSKKEDNVHIWLINFTRGSIFDEACKDIQAFTEIPLTGNTKKVIIDLTMMWCDAHFFLTEQDFYRQSQVRDLLASNEEKKQFFSGTPFWTVDAAERLRIKTNSSKAISFCCFKHRMFDALDQQNKELPKGYDFVEVNRGFCEWVYSEEDLIKNKKIDIILTGTTNNHYPSREKALNELFKKEQSLFEAKVLVDSRRHNIEDTSSFEGFSQQHIRYLKSISEAKLSFVGPSFFEVPVPKYFESMGSGAVVVTPRFHKMEKAGLVHNETCIVLDSSQSYETQIVDILKDIDRIEHIRKNALNFFKENCTYRKLAKDVISSINTP